MMHNTTVNLKETDAVIIGGGLYGCYAAAILQAKGKKVVILEYDSELMSRATYVNQARVHYGYHYPRSVSTALKSIRYFERFIKEYSYAINNSFKKIYAITKRYSLTSGTQFETFCNRVDIPCKKVPISPYFDPQMVEAAFETKEYAFDAEKIKEYYQHKFKDSKEVTILYNSYINEVSREKGCFVLHMQNDYQIETPFVLNATYSGVNQLIDLFGYDIFDIKYEICEVILCSVSKQIKDYGLTLMDGPFFSLMPFGLTPYHSITSVTFTPHTTSYKNLPEFVCQKDKKICNPRNLGNCNLCNAHPRSSWGYMHQLAKKYLNPDIHIHFEKSLFAIKPILKSSELDDSRPTVIKKHSDNPTFISVLSGKINTLYDLDEVLQ